MKMIRILFVLLFASSLFAELYKPHRFVELGVDATVGASNNYFKIDEVLVSELTIDLQKIAKDLSDGGFTLDFMTDENIFLNFNLGRNKGEKFRVGFFAGLEGSGYMNIPHELFDLLGNGYAAGETVDFAVEGYADLFLNMGANVRMKLFEKYGITITPTYYVPFVYIDKVKATAKLSSSVDGRIYAEAHAPLAVYSAFDLQRYIDNDFETSNITEDISSALSSGGFDLSFAVERPIFRSLEVGAFTRIPMVPATLDHKLTMDAYAYYEVNNLMGILDDSMEDDKDYGTTDATYTDGEGKHIWRPFRIGAEAAWRPFGNWFTIRPLFALVVRNPFDGDTREVYPEYSLSAEATLFNVLGINFGTALKNHVYMQHLGFMVNLRLLEINAKVMLRGADFINSFGYGGVGAYVGLRLGF